MAPRRQLGKLRAVPRGGREQLVVRAGSSSCWLEASRKSFNLNPSHVNQTAAVRLLLRLLISTRKQPAEEWLNHSTGPWLKLGTEIRIPWGRWIDVLGSYDGDTARYYEQRKDRYTDEVRDALCRLLAVNLGLPGVFERDAARGYDGLDLGAVEPDVDLVKRAGELVDAQTLTGKERIAALAHLEVLVQGTFEDPESQTVHPHLTPFAEPLAEMYLEVLRGIVDAAADFPDQQARELVTDVGPKLAWYGERGFAGTTAVRFLMTAQAYYGAEDERWDLLVQVFGDEDRIPEAAQELYRSGSRKIALRSRPTPFEPGDLRTGVVVSMRDADAIALGVHKADPRHVPAGATVPPYITRSCEATLVDRLSAALKRPGMSVLVVSGASTAGKTRLAFEVLHRTCSHAFVIAPTTGPNLLRVIDPANHPEIPDARSLVLLWLDDLEQFLTEATRLTAGHLREIGGRWQGRLIVLCTYGGRGLDEMAVGRVELAEFDRILSLASDDDVEVPTLLDDSELPRVATLRSAELLADVDRYGLGPALTAPRLLHRRYKGVLPSAAEILAGVDWQEGQALVDALLGWRATTEGAPMPLDLARQAWVRTRSTRSRRSRPTRELWDVAVAWATAEVVPGRALAYEDWSRKSIECDPAVEPDRAQQHALMAGRLFGDLIPGFGADRPRTDVGGAP